MTSNETPQRGWGKRARIGFGVAGFVVLTASAPCVLSLFRQGYAGAGDPVGLFGAAGAAGLMLFIGLVLLYQAFKSTPPAEE